MNNTIELAKRISNNLSKDWEPDYRDLNIWFIFEPLYKIKGYSTLVSNTIAAYIVFAYHNESNWLDYKKDRFDNKNRILISLGAKPTNDPNESIVENANDEINAIVAEFLISQVSSQWKQALSYLDYAAETIRFATKKTEEEKTYDKLTKEGIAVSLTSDIDIEKILKAQVLKSDLLDRAASATEKAHKIIEGIGKEFLELNQVTQAEFGFEVASEKALHYPLWRDWIRNYALDWRKKEREERLKATTK